MKRKYQVWHCTDTKAGRGVSKQDLIQWQIIEQNWSRLGYSKMIHLDGDLEVLIPDNNDSVVDLMERSNGVGKKDKDGVWVNHVSQHIVNVGGRNKAGKYADTRTTQQKARMASEIWSIIAEQDDILIAGHYQFDEDKKWFCPGFDMINFCLSIGVPHKNIYDPKNQLHNEKSI
ncbi:MAG: hypothetical protein JXR07_19905 [Reichenbachiella sp.]